MNGLKVLDFVARELKGRILTETSLAAFVAAEKAADILDMTAPSREAAELAVLLPRAPLERIREEFGQATADIAEALCTGLPGAVALKATTLHGMSGSRRTHGDGAIAAFAAEAAVASEADRETMMDWLDSMAERESDAVRRAFLGELRGQLPVPGPADPERKSHSRTKVISISMDVSGSTKAKAKMRKWAWGDHQKLARWYEAFHSEFLRSEWRFYKLLFEDSNGEIGLDWRRAFVVKGIGDEIWLLYEVDEKEERKLAALFVHLMRSALEIAGCPIIWTSASDDDEGGGDSPLKTKHLPLKFYIDILDDVFEVSGPRRDFVTQRLPELLGTEQSWYSSEFIELGNRLHAGSLMGDGRRLVTTIRTDYIGWEVDRFFRATKFALPGVVTVGRTLFESVVDVSAASGKGLGDTGLRKAEVPYPIQQSKGTWSDNSFRYVKKDILRKKIKGVGEDYAVYRVLRARDLLNLRYTEADGKIMEETFKVFTREMENAERAEQGA